MQILAVLPGAGTLYTQGGIPGLRRLYVKKADLPRLLHFRRRRGYRPRVLGCPPGARTHDALAWGRGDVFWGREPALAIQTLSPRPNRLFRKSMIVPRGYCPVRYRPSFQLRRLSVPSASDGNRTQVRSPLRDRHRGAGCGVHLSTSARISTIVPKQSTQMVRGSPRIARAVPPREAAVFFRRLRTRSREPSRASARPPCCPSRADTVPNDAQSDPTCSPKSYTAIDDIFTREWGAVAQPAANHAQNATALAAATTTLGDLTCLAFFGPAEA